MSIPTRTESDSMGPIEVPVNPLFEPTLYPAYRRGKGRKTGRWGSAISLPKGRIHRRMERAGL